MTRFDAADSLHRLVKEALDSGEAQSLEEAQELFGGFRIGIELHDRARDAFSQVALLTAVALARRVFLGGVTVCCSEKEKLLTPLPFGSTVGEAVYMLGGKVGPLNSVDPVISVADCPLQPTAPFHIRTAFSGWRGGFVPAKSSIALDRRSATPLAAILSSALAVNEAFSFVRTWQTALGRRPVGLSLWNPSPHADWINNSSDGPELTYLPSGLWILGLGHLGQAFLWALSSLPYADPKELNLVLQDFDEITPSTESTSILSDNNLVGQRKTRAMAAFADRRGFTNSIVERRFGGIFRRNESEPSILLSGVDNALARRSLDTAGFDLIFDAGLGRGHKNYRSMRLHTLPSSRSAAEIWSGTDQADDAASQPGYQKLLADKALDRCGITLLAGKAVGAPFVGSVAACLIVSEVLRMLHGAQVHQVIDLDLQSVEHRTTVLNNNQFSQINPGFVKAQTG